MPLFLFPQKSHFCLKKHTFSGKKFFIFSVSGKSGIHFSTPPSRHAVYAPLPRRAMTFRSGEGENNKILSPTRRPVSLIVKSKNYKMHFFFLTCGRMNVRESFFSRRCFSFQVFTTPSNYLAIKSGFFPFGVCHTPWPLEVGMRHPFNFLSLLLFRRDEIENWKEDLIREVSDQNFCDIQVIFLTCGNTKDAI